MLHLRCSFFTFNVHEENTKFLNIPPWLEAAEGHKVFPADFQKTGKRIKKVQKRNVKYHLKNYSSFRFYFNFSCCLLFMANIYVYLFIFICLYLCIYILMYLYIYIFEYLYIYIFMYLYIYILIYSYIYLFIYLKLCICAHTFIYL